jgi:hypothetical protein
MHAFGCRKRFLVCVRLNPKLVYLDPVHIFLTRFKISYKSPARDNEITEKCACADGRTDGLEPALYAAIKRIVVAALEVRLMFTPQQNAPAQRKHRMATAAIASAARHILIRSQLIPTFREGVPALN